MTKAEIIEAINSTIVANGQKGITAESLANLLIEMASATPESSGGSGALNIICPMIADASGVDYELTEEDKAHNAEVYSKYLECFNNGTALPLIVADFSPVYTLMMGTEVSYVETPMNTIFTPSEIEGVVGLAFSTFMGGQLMFQVNEDGSVTIME